MIAQDPKPRFPQASPYFREMAEASRESGQVLGHPTQHLGFCILFCPLLLSGLSLCSKQDSGPPRQLGSQAF